MAKASAEYWKYRLEHEKAAHRTTKKRLRLERSHFVRRLKKAGVQVMKARELLPSYF